MRRAFVQGGSRNVGEVFIGIGLDVQFADLISTGFALNESRDLDIVGNYSENIKHYEAFLQVPIMWELAIKAAFSYEKFQNLYPSLGYGLEADRRLRQFSIVINTKNKNDLRFFAEFGQAVPYNVDYRSQKVDRVRREDEVEIQLGKLRRAASDKHYFGLIGFYFGHELGVFD